MLSYKNSDHGWGGYVQYKSANFHTALALQALKAINYQNQATISYALGYLQSTQNTDGGWGFYGGDDSNAYMTAVVLQTLAQFKTTYNLQAPITSAASYLLTKQNPDGGFGSSPSAVYETALAMLALVESGQGQAQPMQNALGYLTATQLPNGSWNDDPYSTALALRALASNKPNPAISSVDITFSLPAPKTGDTITITANIRNTGPAQADNITVQFHDGDPQAGGILLGETAIGTIPAYGSAPASITWTIPTAAEHRVYVTIDPLNTIDEISEADNIASKLVTSATLPDLSVTSADIDVFPPAPEPYIMTAIPFKIRNLGETDATNVRVDVYNGDPANGGVKLPGSGVVALIPAGGVVDAMGVIAAEDAIGGSKTIHILIDPQNAITETNENNNIAAKSFIIGSSVDLSVVYTDMTFTPANPRDGDMVTVSSIIRNNNLGTARNIVVRHYLGDPGAGGTRIGSDIIIPSLAGRSSAPVSIQFNTTGHTGNNRIYVVVDPDDAMIELNELNNVAYRTLKVATSQGPDVMVTVSDISVTPSSPMAGQKVTVSATVRNIGNKDALSVPVDVSIVNPADSSSLIIGTSTIAIIPVGSSAAIQISWDVVGFTGSNQIQVTADPDNLVVELNETNNAASVPVTIAEVQGPDILQDSIDLSGIVKDSQTRTISGSATITLGNGGNQPTNVPFTVLAFEDRNSNLIFDPVTDVIMGQASYPSNLAPGATAMITLPISGTVQFIDSPVYLLIDSGNAVAETDEANNINCLAIFTTCRNSTVDAAVKAGAAWLIDHQLNVDTAGTMKAWAGSPSISYDALSVNAYFNTAHVSQSKYVKVLNRLLELQAPDGSWDESWGMTADAVMALLNIGISPDAASIKNAISWMIRTQSTDGSWGQATGTGMVLTAILKAGTAKNDPCVLKAVQWLRDNQNSDGYWGLYVGEASNAWVGPYPAIGLARATSPADPDVLSAKSWYDARRYSFTGRLIAFWLQLMLEIDPAHSAMATMTTNLLNSQNSDGGWKEGPTLPLSSFRTTADVLDVLGRRGVTGTKIDRGITWIDNHINALWEGFDDQKTPSITAWALNALEAADIGDSANLSAISKGRLALVTYQIADGSWSSIPIGTGGWVDITAEALFAMKYPKSISASEQTAATKAVNYLVPKQKADGGWPQSVSYNLSHFPSSEGVLKALLQYGMTATQTNVAKGLTYLNAKQMPDGGFDSVSYTAHAAIIYKLAGPNYQARLNQTIAWLKSKQQPDGSWRTTSSTSWALIALSMAGESGIEVARGAIWLIAAQNQDRGWGEVMGVPISYDSNTALAVWALSLVKFTLGVNLDLATERNDYCPGDIVRMTATVDKPAQDITLSGAIMLQNGTSYQLPFTLSGDTFTSEFAIPADSLPGSASAQAVGIATYGYGVSNKSFTIRNCTSLKPDLSVADQDMTETAGDPINLDIRTITATVRNLGDQDANTVTVNFYKNAVTPEGLIESKSITNLPAYIGTATVETTVTVTEDTVVYAIADPDNTVAELNETDNIGTIMLTRKSADLSITNTDISLIPPGLIEGQAATIAAVVHNTGNIGASNVVVSFYDGDPQGGGVLIGSVTKSYIDAGQTAYAEMPWSTFGQPGMNYIHVVVDPQNLIRESNEDNNASLIPVDVAPPAKPDLAITSTDMAFSILNPEEGTPVTLTATIRNLGTDTSNFDVYLYDEDPASGGKLLSIYTVKQIVPFGGTYPISFQINTLGLSGTHRFYISIDPENRIDEVNETNNTAWNSLTIGASGMILSIVTDKAAYSANEDIQITLNITNQKDTSRTGILEIKILDLSGNVVSAATISQTVTVGPSETQGLSFMLNTGQILAGGYRVLAQFMEGGNAVSRTDTPITITPVKDLSTKITADRIAYFPNQQAEITATITSLSQNYIFENLAATVTITSPASQILYTGTQTIPILTPGQMIDFKTYWNTATYPAGAYPVTLEVRDSEGIVLAAASATLTITDEIKPSKLLRGQISVDKQSLLQGDPVNISYQVTNVGNIDLSQVDLSIRTVHVVKQTVYDLLTDQTALLKGAGYANAQTLRTDTYTAKDYLAILSATIAGVEESLASTYFRVEGAPSAPSLNAPPHGSDVETTTPVLSINNATDPNDDRLRYEIELYSDAGLTTLVASSGLMDEGTAITSWQEPASLQENAWYFWRARAFDGLLYGEWMSPAAFRVNGTNEAPGAPSLSAPSEAASVDTTTPLLAVNNATDPDSINLTYNFVLASDPGFTAVVASQVGVFEGTGTTSWQVPVPLQENTWYYWTAQADDWLITGPWMSVASFFVNTTNEAPSAPVIIEPADGTAVASTDVLITALNSTDPDSSVLTYLFEADTTPAFDSPDRLISGSLPQGSGTTPWLAPGLRDNTWYYTRVRANDGQADSPLSETVRFFVNTRNDAPTAPVLANPSNGSGVNSFSPALSVHNATDIDNDILTYEFEIYADASLTSLVGSASGIQETALITSWVVTGSLTENSTYYWRARAFDGQLYGPWMAPASFMVNTANDAPTAPTLNSPAMGSSLSTLTPVLAINNATDPDSDVLTYDFEIYTEGVLVKSTNGIPQNISGVTSYAVTSSLSDNTTYQWRARAYDGDRYGAWMDMATFSIHLSSQNITATIDFDPNTLDQKSKGNWVTVYIELPAGYNVANINISSLRLNGFIPAEAWPYAIGDYDHDGIPDLMVKFERNAVINLLPAGDKIKVTVTGTVGSTTFEGVDTIRVIH